MNNYKVNPFFFCYKSVENVVNYAAPSAIFVAGHENRYDPAFQEARKRGAEVFAYFNLVNRPDTRVGPLNSAFYMGDPNKVPLWPYPTPGARSTWPNTKMVDLRVGSIWLDHAMDYLESVITEGVVDGFFLDVIGSQLYNTSDWKNWPVGEQTLWQEGAHSAMRRLDEIRRRINPEFKFITNNTWHRLPEVEKYVDGVCMEHSLSTSLFHTNYVGRAFNDLRHRRVFVIARDAAESKAWAEVNGVTHVTNVALTSQGGSYASPTPPAVPYNDLRESETVAKLERQITELLDTIEVVTAEKQHIQDLLNIERNENDKLIEALDHITSIAENARNG